MNYFITTLFLLIGFISYPQFGPDTYNYATLILRNGDILKGEAKIKNDGTIKFRDGNDKTTFDYKNLKRCTINDFGNIESYVYKIISEKGPRLLKVILEGDGKIDLYAIEFNNSNNNFNNPSSGISPYGVTSGASVNVTEYYVNVKENDHEVIKIGNNHPIFGKRHFKKTISDFFKDCPELISQVENGEFKRNDMIQIVKFYNENCGQL